MKSMKLRNLKKLWVLCGVAFMAMPVAAGCICSLPMEQTESGDAISEEQRQELNMLRKKYKLPSPKANAREIETAKIQVQLARLNRVDEHTVTGTAFAKNGKVTLQQARDLGKTVRALATAVEQEGGSARKEFNLFLDYLFTQQVIESVPKYKYSNYNDVRKVPADLLSALSVCDDWRKARLIAAVQNLLEAEQLHWDAEDIRNHVNSDYLFNVTPHLFVCAVHHPDDEVAVKELSAFSRFLSACTQYSPGGKDVLKRRDRFSSQQPLQWIHVFLQDMGGVYGKIERDFFPYRQGSLSEDEEGSSQPLFDGCALGIGQRPYLRKQHGGKASFLWHGDKFYAKLV